MSQGSGSPVLVVNTGSSSLKFGLFEEREGEERLLLEGSADGIGRSSGKMEVRDGHGAVLHSEDRGFASQGEALDYAAGSLRELSDDAPAAVGHRVVHGGPRLVNHQRITPALIEELRSCVHFAPLHIPMALELIQKAAQAYPNVPQFACFDTAFHTTMPETASRFALPVELFDEGIRRYGFHGLSYESVVHQLGSELPERVVVAHLGSGASLAAVRAGKSVDTTMGLTPTGGIPMATRSGDLDPGVLLYLMRAKNMDAEALEQLLNHASGLTALSGGTADMRDLQAAADSGDPRAQLAVEIFCGAIREVTAAYTAVLGGVDMLVFTGGIGEHSNRVRSKVCAGLGFLGIELDASRNEARNPTISASGSTVSVRIVPSQEDLQIARHCWEIMRTGSE